MEFNQRLFFVTGKGGTGKSFLSSILATKLAKQGKKVLLVDAEATGAIARQFEHKEIGYEPVEVANNVFAFQSYTDEALTEYLNINAKIPTWAKLTPLAKLIDLVSNAAPGVREILITGKACYEVKRIIDGQSDYDVVVVDAPSSGHIISILDAPRALSEIVSRGMIRSQTDWMQDILADEKTTGVFVVTTVDEVVIAETNELLNNIKDKTQVNIAGVIVNKDVADLNRAHDNTLTIYKGSDRLSKVKNYYISKIQQSRSLIAQLEDYKLLCFPFIEDTLSSLRSVIKNSDRLLQVAQNVEQEGESK